MSRNIALVLSGGTGTRLGSSIPKQYIEVGGKPIISYVLETLVQHEMVDAIQIVAAEEWQEKILHWLTEIGGMNKFRGFSSPGANRQLSIYNGCIDIAEYAENDAIILTQDAARPLTSVETISGCFNAIRTGDHDGSMPVLPMKDTVYQSYDAGKTVGSLLKRQEIFAGQSPEAFLLEKYIDAQKQLLPDKILSINGATEPAIMAGMDVAMITGDENNFKITTKADLLRFENEIKKFTR